MKPEINIKLKQVLEAVYDELDISQPPEEDKENQDFFALHTIQQLTDELKKYRLVFNQSADPVFIHSIQGAILESNTTASSVYGYSPDEFKRMNLHYIEVPDDDAENAVRDSNWENEDTVCYETCHQSKAGEKLHVEVKTRKMTWKNQPAVISICRDITERKKAQHDKYKRQNRLKYIVQQLQDGIIVFKKSGKIIIWNSGMENLTGIMAKDAINHKLYDLQYDIMHGPHKDRTFIKKKFDEVVSMVNPDVFAIPFENQILHPEKGVCTIQATVYPIRIGEDKFIYGSVLRDITHNKNIENQLRELNFTKDKIFSIIAHDLKTPFSSIIGFTDILLEKYDSYDSDKINKIIQYINLAAKPTLAVLDNLLEWVNAQTGRLGFQPRYFYLNHLLKEVTGLLYPSASIKNIELLQESTGDIEVFADYNMMSSVLRNLITNAIKFTNPLGQVTLSSSLKDDTVEIVVADTGIGMDEKRINTIFQLEKSITTKGTAGEKGSGLGLILCKEFIERHGGSIGVESQQGVGTKFIVVLPVIYKEKSSPTDVVNNQTA